MLEKFALLKIALCNAPAFSNKPSGLWISFLAFATSPEFMSIVRIVFVPVPVWPYEADRIDCCIGTYAPSSRILILRICGTAHCALPDMFQDREHQHDHEDIY